MSTPLNAAETVQALEPFTVTAPATTENNSDYFSETADTATRNNTPLLATPYSVGVITQKTLIDSQAQRLEDAAMFVSGVQQSEVAGSGGFSTDLIIRGFSTAGSAYLNGVLDNQKFLVRDMALVERIDILKGQSSVLYGAGAPGGTVNYVTKKPQSFNQQAVSVALGNDDYSRLVFDSTGKVNGDSDLLYRMIAVGQLADDFRDNVSNNKATLAPSLTWHYADTGSINTEFEYSYQNLPYRFDNVYTQNQVIYDKSYVDPRAQSDRDYWRVSTALAQDLFSGWSARLSGNYFHVERHDVLFGFNTMIGPTTLAGLYSDIHDHYDQFNLRGELHGEFKLWGSRHHVIVGTERNESDDNRNRRQSIGGFTLDVFNPVFDSAIPETTFAVRKLATVENGYYINEQMDLTKQWHVSGGLRYSTFNPNTDLEQAGRKDAFTYNAGLAFTPTDTMSGYFGYSQSFQPNTDLDRNDHFLPAKRGELIELGIKTQGFNHRLGWSAAIYQLDQDHLSAPDPLNPNEYVVSTGAGRSRGFESDLSGQLSERLQVIANYSLLEAKFLQGGLQGKNFRSVPTHSGSIWGNYTPSLSTVPGALQVGGGLVFVASRQGDDANSFKVPGYIRPDLMVNYQLENIALRLKVENLLDSRYVSTSVFNDNVVQGNRRLVRLMMSMRFN